MPPFHRTDNTDISAAYYEWGWDYPGPGSIVNAGTRGSRNKKVGSKSRSPTSVFHRSRAACGRQIPSLSSAILGALQILVDLMLDRPANAVLFRNGT